jgi:micrococcal nuclease
MIRTSIFLIVWTLIVLSAIAVSGRFGRAASLPAGFVQVTKVFDGDTIEVALPEGRKKIRLLGVNTPESVDPNRPIQCFGPEASHFAKSQVRGHVRLEADPTRSEDKYGRLLRYVYLADGTLFNQRLIAEGYGQEYTYQGQSYAHQADFKRVEAEARQAGRGLWSQTTCRGDIRKAEPL